MDKKILLVLEGAHHIRYIPKILAKNSRSYEVCGHFASNEEMLQTVSRKISSGTRIIVSSGGYYDFLTKTVDIPVVTIKRSRIPFATAIREARSVSSEVAILARNGVFLAAAEQYSSVFDDPVPIESFENNDELMVKLSSLKERGIKALVVGSWGIRYAPAFGFTCVTVPFDESDILNSIDEAEHILRYLEMQQKTSAILKLIQNNVSEGIIAIDEEYRISEVNNFVVNLLGVRRSDLDGKLMEETLLNPISQLDSFRSQTGCRGELVTVKNHLLTVSIMPVVTDEKSRITIITFIPVKQLQQNESELRSKLFTKGHTASFTFNQVIGGSDVIRNTIYTAKRYARVDSSVLISAPSGCGKEMFAQSIHNSSRRKDAPFVVINCAAMPENLLESILFGYAKGAYTGAVKEGRQGLFVLAHEGTVFLDEISEMPLSLQSRFLRVLQEKEVVPLGSDQVIPVDIRILAATNRDLEEQVRNNKFREDLYYRLAVLNLEIPTLNQRKDDIPQLVRHFLYEKGQSLKLNSPEIDDSALLYLKMQDYPGNVRQLGNIVERMLVLHEGDSPIDVTLVRTVFSKGSLSNGTEHTLKISYSNQQSEIEEIRNALLSCNGNRIKTADLLKISTTTLWRKIKKYGL